MAGVRNLVAAVQCVELPGVRDFAVALEPFRVGTLSGTQRCFSFRFLPSASGKSVNLAYQSDERIDAEWYHFDDWLTFPEDIGDEPLSVPAAPLKAYQDSNLVDFRKPHDGTSDDDDDDDDDDGGGDDDRPNQVHDHFLHMISKLNGLRSIVEPVN